MRAIPKAKIGGLKPIRAKALPMHKNAQRMTTVVKGKRVTPKALPAKALPAKLGSAHARQTWGNTAKPVMIQVAKQPMKHLATTNAAASSGPKAGSVKIPVVNDGKLNIMWSNASLSPTNVCARITALKKWLKANVATCPKNESGFHDCILDVSHNKMGERAVGELLDVLQGSRVAVRILKLYHMDLTDGVAMHIAKLIKANGIRGTPVREIHLSHNKLGRQGVQLIIAAAGNSGAYPYPRISGSRKLVSLWLRLEHNPIPRVDNVFDWANAKGWSICSDSPCNHHPTCMIAVPSFSAGPATPSRSPTPIRPVTAMPASSYAMSPIPGRGKGKGDGGAAVFPGKGKGKGTSMRPVFPSTRLALRRLSTSQSGTESYQAGYQSGTESTKGGKGAGKGKKGRKGGRPGAPPDPETRRRGKEVHRLLWDMAQAKTLVQSWLPDWGRASPYQRIEWFGDKILGHLLTERVWSNLDHTSEAFLTQFHQQATCNKTLAYIFDMCDVNQIMEAMNTTPKSREPLRAFKVGNEKDVIKRRGDAIEVIFGDLSQQSPKFVDTGEAQKISSCLQLLTDLCLRCAEYFFEMPFSGRKNTTTAVASPSASLTATNVVPKNAMKALSKAGVVGTPVPKSGPGAVCKMGTPQSKASSKCRPSGMTIAIAVSPERYQQGDTVRPQVGERVVMGVLKYTECVLLNVSGWLHLPAVDPLMKKFDEWAPGMDLDCDFVLGRHELSLLALTPFALNISWTMRIDHRNKKTLLKARTMTDTTSKDAKATALRVSKIDVTNTQEFPTCGVMVTLGAVKFFVVLDGCDFRDQDGKEMDLAMGPENDETLRQWWTKTLFVPQVVGVITGPTDEKPVEVERVEVFPQEELAKGLDRKVSYGFMRDVFNAIRTIVGSKTTASAIVDYVRDSGEVKVFEIAPVKPKATPYTLTNHLHAKAAPTPPSPSAIGEDQEGDAEFYRCEEEEEEEPDVELSGETGDADEELEFDGGEFEEHSSFLKKLQALTADLEFDDDTEAPGTEDFSSWEKTGATDVSASDAEGMTDTEFDVEFDDDGGSMLAEGELDFDGDYESSYDGDAADGLVFEEEDDLDIDLVDFPKAADDAGSDAEDILIEGDQADDVVLEDDGVLLEDNGEEGEEGELLFEAGELDIDELGEEVVDEEEGAIDYAAVAFLETQGAANQARGAAPTAATLARAQAERTRGAHNAPVARAPSAEEELRQRRQQQQAEARARARQEEKRVQLQQMEDDARLQALLESEERQGGKFRGGPVKGVARVPQHVQKQEEAAQHHALLTQQKQVVERKRRQVQMRVEAHERTLTRLGVVSKDDGKAYVELELDNLASPSPESAESASPQEVYMEEAQMSEQKRRKLTRHSVQHFQTIEEPEEAIPADDAEADFAELELDVDVDVGSSEDYAAENKSDVAMEAELAQEDALLDSDLIDATHLAARMLAADLAQDDDDEDLAFD
eukprot:GEMP01000968.1.p1 GENE.GEMP01000968.1~~GEMP01000968.1.p1  ORF type:complete len:1463 (+),score=488.12 GEMP01000968.1:145-4533(+)